MVLTQMAQTVVSLVELHHSRLMQEKLLRRARQGEIRNAGAPSQAASTRHACMRDGKPRGIRLPCVRRRYWQSRSLLCCAAGFGLLCVHRPYAVGDERHREALASDP